MALSACANSNSNPPAEQPDAGSAAVDAGSEACALTVAQTEGPFGQEALERSDLNLYGHEGVPFVLSGRVLDRSCRPILGARVLMWHASPSPPGARPRTVAEDTQYTPAVYDHQNEAGKRTPDGQTAPTGERMYYGWVRTDSDGLYTFSSLRPGWYLNGSRYRTSHLHVKVWVADQELIASQIYFPDDPFNGEDGIFEACATAGNCTMEIDSNGVARYDLHVNA